METAKHVRKVKFPSYIWICQRDQEQLSRISRCETEAESKCLCADDARNRDSRIRALWLF